MPRRGRQLPRHGNGEIGPRALCFAEAGRVGLQPCDAHPLGSGDGYELADVASAEPGSRQGRGVRASKLIYQGTGSGLGVGQKLGQKGLARLVLGKPFLEGRPGGPVCFLQTSFGPHGLWSA